jgi:PhzF family phenazine biosynthesis protein
MPIPYYHVDSFADDLFEGNPAGVCICSAFPSDKIMQRIAAENRHSETAFVVLRNDGDFDLRWFTPEVEDDLCGHATLAAAYVLTLRNHKQWPAAFHTRSGVLTVARQESRFEMDFLARSPQVCEPPDGLLPALGPRAGQVCVLFATTWWSSRMQIRYAHCLLTLLLSPDLRWELVEQS